MMNKIIISLFAAALALGFSGCKETWDENPVLVGHEGTLTANFLNEPQLKTQPIMLTEATKDGTLHLTCSQPDYGYAAIVTYQVQVSLDENFLDYKELKESFYDCSQINPLNKDVASAIETLSGVEDESQLPLPYQKVYFRLRAYIQQSPDNTEYLSNVVSYDAISADFYAVWKVGLPSGIYIRGGLNNWGNDWVFSNPTPEEEAEARQYEFLQGEEENTWVIENITLPVGEFKVADNAWKDINYGANGSPIPGEPLVLVFNGPNISLSTEFTGKLILTLTAGTYKLLLDPTPAE